LKTLILFKDLITYYYMPLNAIKYENTIIYKLVCKDLNIKDLYVGHTTNFTKRKQHHKRRCTEPNQEGYNFKVYVTIRNNGGWDNWTMIEIEKFSCLDANEARARERYWFETLNANLNMVYPNRTQIEYRETNAELIKQRKRNYYQNNRECMLTKKNSYVVCDCGVSYTYSNKDKHIRQNKTHLEYVNII